jgi:hypothetical protein
LARCFVARIQARSKAHGTVCKQEKGQCEFHSVKAKGFAARWRLKIERRVWW